MLVLFHFDLSFCVSTVVLLVIHYGVSPFRQALRYHTRFLCKLVKFISQKPWTPFGPGAFQLRISFNIFFSFCYKICTSACLFFSFISFLISLNNVAYLLCSTSWPQISEQNVFASCASGITISFLSSLHLCGYKTDAHYF